MTSVAGGAATMRHKLTGVLTVTAPGGAVVVAATVPSATAAPDPCSASEMARTVGSVATSAGEYLDKHPQTNQAMTTILQQPAGPQSVGSLKNYFEANPTVVGELQAISAPLTDLSTKCKLPVSIPQMLGMMQGAQGFPGTLPGGAAPAQPVAGAPPAPTGPLPGPAATAPTVIR